MKKLFWICFFVIAHSSFAFDNYTQFAKRLEAYQQQLTKLSTIQDEKILSSFLPMINAYKTPYAKIHEHTDLFQWQLFQNCYFKYSTDTSSTVINLDVEYKPIDDFFSTIPAYFFIDTKRPHSSLADYKNYMINVFKSLGTNHSVIIDKEDKSYGFPGYHYCLSFNYSTTKMVIDCYFVYVDNVACAVYYMTGYSYYSNILYKMFFDLILAVLEFKSSTGIVEKNISNPVNFELTQNYPNPFNIHTKIDYFVNEPTFVLLEIYDSIGRLVSTLVNNNHKPGKYSVSFDAGNLSSGVYIYKLCDGKSFAAHRMVLVK